MTIPFLDLSLQNSPLKQQLQQVLSEAIDSSGFVGGQFVSSFEINFAKYIGAQFCIGVSNGTEALRLALVAMGIKPGSRIVTVPNTFIATTEAITQAGSRIDFVDINPDTCLMDPNRLEDHLKRRFSGHRSDWPTAIIPVHLYGQCADMDEILSLAQRYDLFVLEDAAQAHGATYKGRSAGSMSDAAGFSFYPGKNLGACGEAGAVTTNNSIIAEKIRILRDHGQKSKYYHSVEGCNGRLDSIQAGFLNVKLPYLEKWNALRREIANFYSSAFRGVAWIRPVSVKPHNVSSHHLYVIHVANRVHLQEHLKLNGISTGLHYPLSLHLQDCYTSLELPRGSFPEAERSADELVSLPIFPELGLDRARKVIDAVLSFKQ
jgi:dTDP-4-amino-4,6-dideoxygalactose transaminase